MKSAVHYNKYICPALWYYTESLIMFVSIARSYSLLNLNNINQLIFVMVKCGVLFEVRTEFLNNI
jgi:hypothetical protein